jgi:glycosyltransferase involved in cell wall biosynthesis
MWRWHDRRSAPAVTRPIRIAVVNTHPIQYFAPLYAALNRADDLDITALYCSDFSLRGARDRSFGRPVTWDIDLLDGYRAKFVGRNAHRIEPYGFFAVVSPALWPEISPRRYDAIWLHGHGHAAMLVALAAARVKGLPVFMRNDAHLGLPVSPAKAPLRRAALGAMFAQCTSALAVGAANHDYYRAMGVPEERITLVPYTVDNDRFIAASWLRDGERRAWRAQLGVTGDAPIILYASTFEARKRPDDLLEAFLLLRRAGADAHLVMVGSGDRLDALRARAADVADGNIHFPGFFNQSELPKVFAACDLFVLPSDNEPYGLIVNEVMCAGLPVVVSATVGCVRDLVREDINGHTFPPGDVAALAAVLGTLLADPARRARMGSASREIIAKWSFNECWEGLRRAIAKAGITPWT